ncbi:MAG TPA: hypothetical protein V6D17_22465 [Candidatus Obscuribacterales bacterium]
MVKLLRKIDVDGQFPNFGWLSKAVYSSAMDAGRQAARDLKAMSIHFPELALHEPNHPYVTRGVVECDLMPRLRKMLEKLEMPLRQALLLHEFLRHENTSRHECNNLAASGHTHTRRGILTQVPE